MLNEDKIRLKGVNLFVLAVSKNAICEEEENYEIILYFFNLKRINLPVISHTTSSAREQNLK